jgi:diguanylate cyclase (GGDEF)-like protein
VYLVPLAIALVSLVALLAWENSYDPGDATPLPVAVLEDSGGTLPLVEAARQLGSMPRVVARDTRRSEAPFWFQFDVGHAAGGAVVELPSRHAVQVECWDADTLGALGRATRSEAEGLLVPAKAGFALDGGPDGLPPRILCRGVFAGPARITALGWSAGNLAASAREFHHNAGLLEGGLLVLTAFVLVTAMVNREWLYVLLAAWLVASLRLGALSAGWDTQWLGRTIPPDWMLAVRRLTMAAYFTLTYGLFARLFREHLQRLGVGWLLHIGEWSCALVIATAVILPYGQFLPVIWLATLVTISIILFHLLRILFGTRSIVALWYSGALGIVLLASVSEVLAAALGLKNLLAMLNSVTAALVSSLMAALAIAEQMRQERVERVHAQAALKSTYDAIPIGLFTLASDGSFERVNPALGEMLRIELERGPRYWREYFEPGSWDRLQDAVHQAAGADIEIRGHAGDEAARWYHVKATLTGQRIEGSLQEVTERYQATEQLKYLAVNDPLTGVLNRRGVEKIIEDATLQAAMGRSLAVAYLDLDRFKLINDLFGHVAGDDVLRQVCRRIERLLAEGQTLGRIGGDEFIIVFRGAPIAAASAICRGIIEAIGSASFQTGDKAFQVKASIGLVEVAGRLPVKDAIAVADRACRTAKLGAGQGLVVFDRAAGVFKERADELRLLERLGTGAAPEGLFLVMQPILSLTSPFDSLNFEVLVRMREGDGSITPAGVIVAAAENNGRAAVIDRWVLSNTLAWLERHHDSLAATRFVTMNLSGASLNDERFMQDAFAMLAGCPRATSRLCIEITEGVALHDLDNTRRFIDRVRGYGAKVALDDFGAGYTSFSYLKELPADALKIDGSFIVNVNAHPANLAIVEAIVELGRNLGMKSIAEWAEDRATVEALAGIGVDYVQGFAISHPQDPAALLAARSSASFIGDPALLKWLRETLAPSGALAQLDALGARGPSGLH